MNGGIFTLIMIDVHASSKILLWLQAHFGFTIYLGLVVCFIG